MLNADGGRRTADGGRRSAEFVLYCYSVSSKYE